MCKYDVFDGSHAQNKEFKLIQSYCQLTGIDCTVIYLEENQTVDSFISTKMEYDGCPLSISWARQAEYRFENIIRTNEVVINLKPTRWYRLLIVSC